MAGLWDAGYSRAADCIVHYLNPEHSLRDHLPAHRMRAHRRLPIARRCLRPRRSGRGLRGPLGPLGTVAALKACYPQLDRACTSDKKLLNMVMGEACTTELWA